MPETFLSASDARQFHDHIVTSLATLDERTSTILSRVEKQNGNVAALFQKFNQVQLELTEHPLACPVREAVEVLSVEVATGNRPLSMEGRRRLEALEKFNVDELVKKVTSLERVILERTIAAKTSAKWFKKLEPILWSLGGAIAILVLGHSKDLYYYFFRLPLPK